MSINKNRNEGEKAAYPWHGTWAKWQIREIEHQLKCLKEGTRTEEEVWIVFQRLVKGERKR